MDEYIEREALILAFNLTAERSGDPDCPWDMSAIETEIEAMPAADVVPVVRCKDCKHYQTDYMCFLRKPDDFCSYGERKDGDGNG